MPTVVERNGEIIWGRTAFCPMCGEDWESTDPDTPEGGFEYCDECMEAERDEEMEAMKI